MGITSTLLLAAVSMTGPQPLSNSVDSSVERRTKCIIAALHEVDLPAMRNGALIELKKHEGDEVEKDELVASMDVRDAEARVEAAKLRQEQAKMQAANTQRIEAAKLAAKVAEFEHEQSKKINERSPGSVSEVEMKQLEARVKQLELTAEVEESEVEVAKVLAKERQQEIVVAMNDLDDREVKSPIRGIVAELFRHDGEWLQQGEPLMRIVELDRLKAEAYVSLNEVLPYQIVGRAVSIELRFSNGTTQTFDDCRVGYVSPEVEPGGRYRIWAEVANRQWRGSDQWILRPGMVAEMVIRLDRLAP